MDGVEQCEQMYKKASLHVSYTFTIMLFKCENIEPTCGLRLLMRIRTVPFQDHQRMVATCERFYLLPPSLSVLVERRLTSPAPAESLLTLGLGAFDRDSSAASFQVRIS